MGVRSPAFRDCVVFFFFQAEDGIRDLTVTGVQTCALPISTTTAATPNATAPGPTQGRRPGRATIPRATLVAVSSGRSSVTAEGSVAARARTEIGRASCRERV